MQMLIDINSKLMMDNARLQVMVDALRKSFQSYIKDSRRGSDKDKQTIHTLRRISVSECTAQTSLASSFTVDNKNQEDTPLDSSSRYSIQDDILRNSLCSISEKLSDIESRKYKKVKRRTTEKEVARKRSKGKTFVTKTIKSEPDDDDYNDFFPSFDWTVNCPNFSHDNFAIDSPFRDDGTSITTPKICRNLNNLSQATTSQRESSTEVDMEDDEIIDIWKTTLIEDDTIYSILSLSQVCVEIVNPTATTTTQEEEEEEHQDNTRKSFIDAEYAKFKEIGKQFSTKRRLPSKPKRKTFTACQA